MEQKNTKNKRDGFSEWYQSVVFDNGLLKYYDVSGCYVMMPTTMKFWELIQSYLDSEFKKTRVENVYFPLLITERNLSREASHIEGFKAEVAWVTHSDTKEELEMKEESETTEKTEKTNRLAIRPTSECAFYPTFNEVIKNHADMPLKWNQWCNVVRWEFSDPTPFIRSREFLWNEGHCAFATAEEADHNANEMIQIYKQFYKNFLSVPVFCGVKTSGERFGGAINTYTIETFISDAGKGIQCATSHNLGQNFSKMFDIRFQPNVSDGTSGNTQFVHQTSWGCTTRSIGTMIMTHGDDKGLILPSSIANYQIIIVPIYKKNTEQTILDYCLDVQLELQNRARDYYGRFDAYRIFIDRRNNKPGWKYNYWEEKGIPFRFEIGMEEVKSKSVVLYSRDVAKKETFTVEYIKNNLDNLFLKYNTNLYYSAFERIQHSLQLINSIDEIKEALEKSQSKLFYGNLCEEIECEKAIKQLKIKPLCRPDIESINKFHLKKQNNECCVCKSSASDGITLCLFSKGF